MTQEEIKSKIADLEKRAKNPSIPASLVTVINQSIANLKSQLKEEAKEEPKKKVEPKAAKEPKVEPKPARKPKAKAEPKKEATTSINEIASKLMSIDNKVWDDLSIKSGSSLYANKELQVKYKNAINNGIMKGGIVKLPFSPKIYDKLEDENHHALNQHLLLMGYFGDEKKADWIDFVENKAKSKATLLDTSIYANTGSSKKEEPKKAEAEKTDDEYCRQLIAQERERRAKAKVRAKERANEPKKTPATKNKEAVEKTTTRVATNVEKRADKGDVNAAEIEKLIKEYEDAIKKLKALLTKVKSGKKMQWGGTADSASSNDPMIGGTMASSLEYAKGGNAGYKTTKNGVMYKIIDFDSPMGKYKYMIKGVKFGGFSSSYVSKNLLTDTEIERIAGANKYAKGGDIKSDYKELKNHIEDGYGYIDSEYLKTTWENISNIPYAQVKDELEAMLEKDDLIRYAKGGTTKKKKRLKASEIIDNEYSALKPGARKSAKVAYVEMRGGTGYYRKNANQYVKAGKAGGREYTENRRLHSDVKKYL